MGNLGPLAVCQAVTTSLKLIDPMTMKRGELRSEMFFRCILFFSLEPRVE